MISMKRACFAVAIIAILPFLAACGGSGGGSGKPIDPPKPLYTVGGTVSGLNGTLVLYNGGNSLTVSANGSFNFSTRLADGAPYNVNVYSHPQGQNCTVSNGSGTIRAANVANIQVSCTNNTEGVTLSGKIAVPRGVVIDGTVNDENGHDPNKSNETFATAQILPNPITVGGYVNWRLGGVDGRSYLRGNPNDYYLVQLKKGDVVTLAIGESDTTLNDLDLHLFDKDRNWVDSSEGTGTYEMLTAPSDGTYYVRVSVYFGRPYYYPGASNYILTIGADVATAATAEADPGILSTQREMVPDQIIVRFKGDVTTAASTSRLFSQYAADMGLTAVAGSPEREMLFSIDDLKYQAYSNKTDDMRLRPYELKSDGNTENTRRFNTLMAIKELRKRSDILSADPNYIVRSYSTDPPVNDPYYGNQWNLPMINAPEAWDAIKGGSEVVVAVVDSGVLMNHPDLSSRLTNTGYNFVLSDGIGPNPNDPGDKQPGSKSLFHGTHVAGIIAAETNNATGVAGVAGNTNTRVMPVRVIGAGGSGTTYDMQQGIRYAAGLSNNSGVTPSKHADIINLSLGGPSSSNTEQLLINEVRAKGIIVIAASGNDNTSRLSYPASYGGVISVSAVNINSERASYSNYGSRIAVAAPGGGNNSEGALDYILSTGGDDSSGSVHMDYTPMIGTSMAAPHVAGVVAMMKTVYPALSPADLDALLQLGKITKEIGRADYYGYGLINAFKAVAAALELAGGGSIAGLDVNPRTVNFGVFSKEETINVSKIGTGALSVSSVNKNAGWLTVTRGPSVNSSGFGTYIFRVDRNHAGLQQEGAYTDDVIFTASSGTSVSVRVTVLVRNMEDITYDAGYHYVLLFKVNADNTIARPAVDEYGVKVSDDGYYYYVFNNVQTGNYVIIAGSDPNNNFILGDGGEALGAFPDTMEQMVVINVANSDISDLDFTTNLRLSISNNAMALDGIVISDKPDAVLPPESRRLLE